MLNLGLTVEEKFVHPVFFTVKSIKLDLPNVDVLSREYF